MLSPLIASTAICAAKGVFCRQSACATPLWCATGDATFVAPVSESQNVRKIVEQLEKTGRLETKFTPAKDRLPHVGAYANRVRHWLFDETLPLWSTVGVDERDGGFHEALSFNATPINKTKRTRTMARQIYAFAVAHEMGWDGPAQALIDHGIRFITANGRTERGGWVEDVQSGRQCARCDRRCL